MPFLSDWSSYHLCTYYFFFFLFRNFCTGTYEMVLKCMSSGHGTCAAASSWELLWVGGRGSLGVLAMDAQKTTETLTSLSSHLALSWPFFQQGLFHMLVALPLPAFHQWVLSAHGAQTWPQRARSLSIVTVPSGPLSCCAEARHESAKQS